MLWLGRYERNVLIASSACSSVSTARSARPETPVRSFQPPRSSGSMGLLIASDVTLGLAMAMIAPLRITTKSAIAEYHVDDPEHWPSNAEHHGVSRQRCC